MGQVLGSLQNIEIDITNVGTSGFKNLVCLRTSSVNTSMDATTEQTNCGVLTSVAEPLMSLDFDAICEVAPSASQISYEDLLTCVKNKTIVMVRVQNPTVTGSSEGAAYYHRFSGYITDLTWNQSTTEFINFSGTIQSTGALDVDPAA
jgi:hypothetical protein